MLGGNESPAGQGTRSRSRIVMKGGGGKGQEGSRGSSVGERGAGGGIGGGGRGMNRPGRGPAAKCLCPNCGFKWPHQAGKPCSGVICPQCGCQMMRDR